MAKVRKTKQNIAEVTYSPGEKWGDPSESPAGSTTYTASEDGATVTVTFLDQRPPQEHTLKAGSKVKESPAGAIHINGDSHP
jgi:hypothetical protein